jgi:hypothetical protein
MTTITTATRRTVTGSPFRNLFFAILVAWLIAGTLDALAAITYYTIQGNKHPEKIFRYIARAALGSKATTGGNEIVVYGVLFHYLIALLFTIFFFLLFPAIKWLRQNVILGGLLYGIFAWVIMNRVVVPLSKLPTPVFNWERAAINMGILMICIGLPIALVAKKHYLYSK